MYTCYILSKQSRDLLISKFPPKYPLVICNHITEKFGVSKDAPLPEQPKEINVIGYVDDGKGLQALLVEIDGKVDRPDGKTYHITLSLDSLLGYKPVDSNKVIAGNEPVEVDPIKIDAVPSLV
jgi:hypothetical protein